MYDTVVSQKELVRNPVKLPDDQVQEALSKKTTYHFGGTYFRVEPIFKESDAETLTVKLARLIGSDC